VSILNKRTRQTPRHVYSEGMQYIEHHPLQRELVYIDETGETLDAGQVQETLETWMDENNIPGTIDLVADTGYPGEWYATYKEETVKPQPLTPAQTLQTFYGIAIATGTARQDPHYQELADDLHRSIMATMRGDDPTQTLKDQAGEWRATAKECASPATAETFRAWAHMLEEATK
jgi:hypothetical protein